MNPGDPDGVTFAKAPLRRTFLGESLRGVVDAFVKSVVAPSRITGKTARWETSVPTSWVCNPRLPVFQGVGTCTREISYAIKANAPGFALQDGLRSQFDHISIVVDTEKVAKMKADAVTDYISMVALAQLSSVETCQGLASITNMLIAGCAPGADALTANDMGYLRGVYQSDPTLGAQAQKNEIGRRMLQAVAGK